MSHARARLRALILESVSEEDLRAIIGAMVQRAKDGDMVAAREVLTRLVDKPPEAPDPDRLDVEEKKLEGEAMMATLAAAWGNPETRANS